MSFALGEPYPISAAHGEGVRALVDMAVEKYPTEKKSRKTATLRTKSESPLPADQMQENQR